MATPSINPSAVPSVNDLPDDLQLWRSTGLTTARSTVHLYGDCQYLRFKPGRDETSKERGARRKRGMPRKTSKDIANHMGLKPCNQCLVRGGLID